MLLQKQKEWPMNDLLRNTIFDFNDQRDLAYEQRQNSLEALESKYQYDCDHYYKPEIENV